MIKLSCVQHHIVSSRSVNEPLYVLRCACWQTVTDGPSWTRWTWSRCGCGAQATTWASCCRSPPRTAGRYTWGCSTSQRRYVTGSLDPGSGCNIYLVLRNVVCTGSSGNNIKNICFSSSSVQAPFLQLDIRESVANNRRKRTLNKVRLHGHWSKLATILSNVNKY